MRCGIIGAGPIGSILGAYLAQGKQEVVFVDILKDHLEVIREQGLTISGLTEIKTRVKATYQIISELKTFNPEVIFICVKTSVTKLLIPDLQNLNESLKAEFHNNLTFVSFQNGLDAEESLSRTFGQDNTLRVVINYAGNFIANGQIKMSFFNKPNYIGALSPVRSRTPKASALPPKAGVTSNGVSPKGESKAKEIARVLTASGLDTEFTTDIKKYVWEKVILNAALSPLCAITTMTMKQAMDFPETYHLVEEILKEGIAVAKSIGYDYGSDFFPHCIKYLKNAGHHKTSMHVDLEAKRPTEIDFLNKKIVEYGRAQGISTPYNDTITCIIKAMERKNGF
jgi:2-dehydropantoate 2-reductase